MKRIIMLTLILSLAVFSCTKKSNPAQPDITPPTATPTITSQAAATATMTGTLTPTMSPTTQAIPADTATMTVTQEGTGTETPADTITATCTPVNTGTPTDMDTATVTSTSTDEDTQTITETITETASPTATCTGTDTPYPYSELITVPSGTFNQTCTNPGLESFSSTITGFKIGQYLVTYELWYAVRQWAVANGYSFQGAGAEGSAGTVGAAPTAAKYQPVADISWRDAIVWSNAYSEKSGLQACYTYLSVVLRDSTNANGAACDAAVCEWANNGYRLPAESEYQYAASWKGTDSSNGAVEFPSGSGNYWTPYNYASGAAADYSDPSATGLEAWYQVNCSGTQDVGGKSPNQLGIFDMSGNIWEWCWDFFSDYPAPDQTDYRGPATGPNRVQKGGAYSTGIDGDGVQTGARVPYGPYDGAPYVGFRIARSY